jgi:ribonuclease P protein component
MLDKVHVHSLRKHEILRKKLPISLLFKSGKSMKGEFLRIVYASLQLENKCFQPFPAILFAVSKKTVPSAVERNRVKRMMREAYRLEKSLMPGKAEYLREGSGGGMLCIAFIYMGRRKTFPDLDAFREEIRVLMESMVLS